MYCILNYDPPPPRILNPLQCVKGRPIWFLGGGPGFLKKKKITLNSAKKKKKTLACKEKKKKTP